VTINADECDEGTIVENEIMGYPQNDATRLDMWRGDQDVGCQDQAQRDPSMGTTLCDHLFNRDGARTQFTLQESAGGAPGIEAYFDCDNDPDGVYSFYGLASNTTMTTAAVPGFGRFDMELDQTAPPAPSNVRAGSGESQVQVRWDSLERVDIFDYRVYVDEEAASCSDSTFVTGDPVPEGVDFNQRVDVNSTSVTVNLANLGLEIGDEVPVAVTSRDFARNESVFSQFGCLTRIETSGFCDLHEADGGQCQDCSLGGPVSRSSGLLSGLLVAAAVWSVRRRARR